MPKKKCPACGSTDTAKILYGMPTHEAFEAAERGEIALGGCCVPTNGPYRQCKACKQEFDGGDIFDLFELVSFEFYVGGFFGTSYFVFIDGKRKNKLIRYAKTEGGIHPDLKPPKKEVNFHPDITLKEIPLTQQQWIAFIEEIAILEVDCWRDNYYDNNICDGTQWKVAIKCPNGKRIIKTGSNEYPPYWTKMLKVMKKYIDKDIE